MVSSLMLLSAIMMLVVVVMPADEEESLKNNIESSEGVVALRWNGMWGDWGLAEFCSPGSFVYGFSQRSERKQGSGDDTALNTIELYCKEPNRPNKVTDSIRSSSGFWGDFSKAAFCDFSAPVNGFQVKEEPAQGGGLGGGDDTSLNEIALYCMDSHHKIRTSVRTGWGSWK